MPGTAGISAGENKYTGFISVPNPDCSTGEITPIEAKNSLVNWFFMKQTQDDMVQHGDRPLMDNTCQQNYISK